MPTRDQRNQRGKRLEFRVTWRRASWLPTTIQSRKFDRRVQAEAFVSKLARGRDDLADLVVLRLDRRPVGVWELVE